MATKKQLDQLQALAEKAGRSQALRKAAQSANGHNVNQSDSEYAEEWLENDVGTRKAKRLRENEIISAGGKPKNPLRRLTGL